MSPAAPAVPQAYYERGLLDSELLDSELPWANRYAFLLSHGYLLRPRYRPGWKPSWKLDPRLLLQQCEDSISSGVSRSSASYVVR